MNDEKLKKLQQALGYKFKDESLLMAALTHSSYANENKRLGAASNERLEFLGDSVLGMAVAYLIYKSTPLLSEGRMTRLRAELVCEKSLAGIAKDLNLGDHLLLGHGEEKNGGRIRPSILADAVEAVIAAIYLDDGFDSVEKMLSKYFATGAAWLEVASTDYKTALQEATQVKPGQMLSYHTIGESGPDHMKSFTVEVRLNTVHLGQGDGGSKKEAEQAAAKSALETLSKT